MYGSLVIQSFDAKINNGRKKTIWTWALATKESGIFLTESVVIFIHFGQLIHMNKLAYRLTFPNMTE